MSLSNLGSGYIIQVYEIMSTKSGYLFSPITTNKIIRKCSLFWGSSFSSQVEGNILSMADFRANIFDILL